MKIPAWGRNISSKLSSMNQYSPDMFVKCQWQRTKGVSVYYLIYRWLIACAFLMILFVSLVDIGRPWQDVSHYAKWSVYLTHWGITTCTMQATLAVYLITRAKHIVDLETMKMDSGVRTYWVMHNCATIGSFLITTIYWLFVFNPDEQKLDLINLLQHVANSVLMAIDLFMVSHPVQLIDFYWPLSISIAYVIFSYIYFLAGGTDRRGRVYIYKILDWRNPGKTLVIIAMCIVFMLVLHLLVCVTCLLRRKSAELCRRQSMTLAKPPATELQGVANQIPIDDSLV